MSKTAILIDGGFFRKRAKHLWGEHSPVETADALITYCMRHLHEHAKSHDLYRMFYYDCPPSDKQVYDPLTGKSINLKGSEQYLWMTVFLSELKKKRKMALRLGTIDVGSAVCTLKYDAVKKLCSGVLKREDLMPEHFEMTVGQKGVDMKLGIDIASLSLKKQVDQIILVTGDSDFVPAAKLARREGIDVVLDPLEMEIGPNSPLLEHIDGLRSCGNPYPRTHMLPPVTVDLSTRQ